MKKSIVKLSMLAFVIAVFFACGKGGGTPEDVVKNYYKAIANENWSAAKKLSTESTHQFIDFISNASQMVKMTGEKPTKKAGKIENLECVVEGDVCNCTMLLDGEREDAMLVKVDGKWLVEQSKEMPGFGWD
jgi:uncharacterized membrane protein YvbJ